MSLTDWGGSEGGDQAAQIARDYIREQLAQFSGSMNSDDAMRKMLSILQETNARIQETEPSRKATTASVVKILDNGMVVIGHAGDSRVSLLRNGILYHLTLDTGESNIEVQQEIAAASDWRALYEQNKVRYARADQPDDVSGTLGGKQGRKARPTTYARQLEPGDRLILTTDGIHDPLTTQALIDEASETSRRAIEAYKAGDETSFRAAKLDDRTAIVINISA